MIRYRYGILLLILAGLAFLGALYPISMKQQASTIALGTSLQHIDPATAAHLTEEFPQLPDCEVELSTRWPDRLRAGMTAGIEQTLLLACPAGSTVDLSIRAMGRLEETTRHALPDGPIEISLRPGQPASFIWRIQVDPAGAWQGILWSSLLVPLSDGSIAEIVLSSLPIQGETEAFVGLSHKSLTNLGWVLAGLGLAWIAITKVIRQLRPAQPM